MSALCVYNSHLSMHIEVGHNPLRTYSLTHTILQQTHSHTHHHTHTLTHTPSPLTPSPPLGVRQWQCGSLHGPSVCCGHAGTLPRDGRRAQTRQDGVLRLVSSSLLSMMEHMRMHVHAWSTACIYMHGVQNLCVCILSGCVCVCLRCVIGIVSLCVCVLE